MLRDATPADLDAIAHLAVITALFEPDEVGLVRELIGAHLDPAEGAGHRCVVSEDGGVVDGVAYYQPRASDRVWDLTMIALDPRRHGRGIGQSLMRHAEADLRGEGVRLLLVDTSATSRFDRTRRFYVALGYDEEARIRDYWGDGDDLVVFRKDLRTAP